MDDLHGKTALVTGATAGIGKVTAASLAGMGARVVLTARSEQKACATIEMIRAAYPDAAIEYLLADFSDLGQVRRLAQTFKQEYSRLDILVNNAGAYFNRRRVNDRGVERTFLVNHLAPLC